MCGTRRTWRWRLTAAEDWSFGAGRGNRTLVFSLEGCCSTIELHPHHARYYTLALTEQRSGGGSRTRTCEGVASGFTVRPLCRSGHSPIPIRPRLTGLISSRVQKQDQVRLGANSLNVSVGRFMVGHGASVNTKKQIGRDRGRLAPEIPF